MKRISKKRLAEIEALRNTLVASLKKNKEMQKVEKRLVSIYEKDYKYKVTLPMTIMVRHGLRYGDAQIWQAHGYFEDIAESQVQKNEDYINDRKKVNELLTEGIAVAKKIAKEQGITLSAAEIKDVVYQFLY